MDYRIHNPVLKSLNKTMLGLGWQENAYWLLRVALPSMFFYQRIPHNLHLLLPTLVALHSDHPSPISDLPHTITTQGPPSILSTLSIHVVEIINQLLLHLCRRTRDSSLTDKIFEDHPTSPLLLYPCSSDCVHTRSGELRWTHL